jgi:PucR C-terminal helix-turn-helix domain
MKDLEARLTALDPDAGAAVRAITYFDRLTDARAGLQAIVRGAAVLTGCPARLTDEARRLRVRVECDGTHGQPGGPPDQEWLSTSVGQDSSAVLWLERPGPAGPVEAIVLERAAAAARVVLGRARRSTPTQTDDGLTEVLVDDSATADARRHAARTLGLSEDGLVHAIASATGGVRVQPISRLGSLVEWRPVDYKRAGVGHAVDILDLPLSWAAAKIALRFTAEGTDHDPGPQIVHSSELGVLALLATSVNSATPLVPDELALKRAAAAAPWMLVTLHAVATNASLRAAAVALPVHHSTLQDRIAHAERLLGWSIHEPDGQHRLHLVLALRRLRRNRFT